MTPGAALWAWLALGAWAAEPLDVNAASAAELEALPGLGAAKARAIVQYRDEHGPFASVERLDDVPGIGPATLAQLRGHLAVTVAGTNGVRPGGGAAAGPVATATKRVNINRASAAEIATLPGIGPNRASAIVADRDARGPFSSCADLSRVQGLGPAAVAAIADRCTVD